MTRLRRVVSAFGLGAAATVTGWGCSEPVQDSPTTTPGTTRTTVEASPLERYERRVAFVGTSGDSALIVSWAMDAIAGRDSVARSSLGQLSRGGTWEEFYAERWTSPPTRMPARILPYGSLRLTVSDGDVIDGIIFDDGRRRLALALGTTRASWIDPWGHTFDLVEGVVYLSDQRAEGLALDMARAWPETSPPPGDWAFLIADDSLQIVLSGEREQENASAIPYDLHRLATGFEPRTRTVDVAWIDTQAFPPARRDVPVAWRVTSADASAEGILRARSSQIKAGEGPGPLLPVRALVQVEGTLTLDGEAVEVRGILVHERR